MHHRTPPLLEQWYREVLRPDVVDISSSGVPPLTVGQALDLAGMSPEELSGLLLTDGESLGTPPLRAAVADAWAGGDHRRVLAAHGSNEVVFLVLNALLRTGDEVVVQEPLYHAYGSALADIGCRIRPWRMAEPDFRPDVEHLADLVGRSTRAVVVNFPHNPTGVSVTPAQQRRIVEVTQRVGAYLVWDNAFAELTYEAPPLPDAAALYARALSIGTLSKAYGLPGLRVGWCIGPPDVLAATIPVRDRTTLFGSPLVESLAAAVVRRRHAFRERHAARLARNRAYFLDWADRRPEVASTTRPAGGVTALVRFTGVTDTRDLCDALARAGTVLVPGAAFGCPAHVRLGFGGPTDELERGFAQVVAHVGTTATTDREAAHAGSSPHRS